MDTVRSACCLVLLGLAASVAGCSTPSINALYSEDGNEVVTDDRVVGTWMEAPEEGKDPKKARYEVQQRTGDKANWYVVKITGESSEKCGSYELRLVKLGAHTYADFYPDNDECKKLSERLGLAALPMHIIYPATVADERVTLRPLDGAKVKALVVQSPKLTPHAIREDMVILTGDSRQVQEFYRKVVDTEDLFARSIELIPAPEGEGTGAVTVPDNTRNRSGRGARPRSRN